MKHPDGTPCELPSPAGSPQLRAEEEQRQPQEALTQKRHDDAANNRRSTEPASPTLKGSEGGPPKPCDCQCEGKKPGRDALDWLTFAVLVLTFIAVSIYAWFARKQATANEEAAHAATTAAGAAERTLRVSERPWLLAQDVIRFDAFPDKIGEIKVKLANTGRSPALNTIQKASVAIHPDRHLCDGEPPYDGVEHRSRGVIGTGGSPTVSVLMKPLREEVRKQLIDHTAVLFVYGYFTYSDEFGDNSHYLRFCYEYDPDTGHFIFADGYNDAG